MREALKAIQITESAQPIPEIFKYLEGVDPRTAFDVKLTPEYTKAVTQYGTYCALAYQDPRIAALLFRYEWVQGDRIGLSVPPTYESHSRVYLVTENGIPRLSSAVVETREKCFRETLTPEEFKDKIPAKYGEDPSRQWVFGEFDEPYHDNSGSALWHIATRDFKPEDLLDDTVLHYFVLGTFHKFHNLRKRILEENAIKIFSDEETKGRINAFTKANDILRGVFEPKRTTRR